MRGGTLFSGIGAPECAMPWVDWRWAAEIDPFASAVHAARFPHVRNLGDVNAIGSAEPVDLVVFGSPCQSFSIAGKRLGLDDQRGNLALVALRLVGRLRPRWVVFENVPGLLSSDGGRDFGAFLGLLGELGYGFAYRVLDAQHFGVPQRRRRVFVVGYLGDWRPPAAVLFEPESLRGDPPPRREAGQDPPAKSLCSTDGGIDREDRHTLIARCVATSRNAQRYDYETETLIAFSAKDHGGDCGENAPTLRAGTNDKSHANAGVMPAVAFRTSPNCGAWETGDRTDAITTQTDPSARLITHSLRADGFDTSEDGTGRGTPLIPVQNATRGKSQNGFGIGGDAMFTLDGASQHAIAGTIGAENMRHTTGMESGADLLVRQLMSVRRLTPLECERLQGLPDGWTLIPYRGKPAADGPRYRAIGNSMAIPCVRWIGERIRQFEEWSAMRDAAN